MTRPSPRIDARRLGGGIPDTRVSLHARARIAAHAADAAQISAEAARIVDPVLTTAARGYRHPAHVRHWLFPRVPVSARGGRRIEFDRSDFRRVNARRAYGGATQRVQFGHEGQKFALEPYRLEGAQPVEPAQDAMAVAGIDMGMRAADGTQALISLNHEIECATLATTVANYPAGHALVVMENARWDAAGANPTDQVMVGVERIRKATGMRPNVMVMGGAVFSRICVHPNILQQIRYLPEGKQIADAADLARMWRLEHVVPGDSIYVDENDVAHDVWGNHVILAYTRLGSVSRAEPTFGYGYGLAGYPMVEQAYLDRNTNTWLYPVADEYEPQIVGGDAGYLMTNVVV